MFFINLGKEVGSTCYDEDGWFMCVQHRGNVGLDGRLLRAFGAGLRLRSHVKPLRRLLRAFGAGLRLRSQVKYSGQV